MVIKINWSTETVENRRINVQETHRNQSLRILRKEKCYVGWTLGRKAVACKE